MSDSIQVRQPLVSVIIPVYNAERYIARCIESILAQTFTNWEIIAVDDGSEDDSLAILRRYESDRRVKIVHIPNSGVVNARNTAINRCIGDFLTFVDADDYLPEDAVELMVAGMTDDSVDLVVGGYTLLWEEDGRIKDVNNNKDFSTPEECIDYCIRFGETFLPVKMYRAELYREAVNIPSDIVLMEDTVGVLQYLSRCRKVATITKSIYVYFKNTGSASMTIRPNAVMSMLKVAEFLLDFKFEKHAGYRRALVDRSGDLLLNVLGNIHLISHKEKQLHQAVLRYMTCVNKLSGFRNIVLRMYVKHPVIARGIYKFTIRISHIKSEIKRFLWKMIYR
jgi:glycosyltransferase involved in cell wall biosynthesis